MTHVRFTIGALLLAMAAAVGQVTTRLQPPVLAQEQPQPIPPAAPPAPDVPAEPTVPPVPEFPPFPDQGGDIRDAVRIGQDLRLAPGDAIRDGLVIFGNASIAGNVDGDLVVILGTARLASTARISGDFVVVGGGASAESGARVDRDMVVVGGQLDAPSNFIPGGEHVVVGSTLVGDWMAGMVPYFSRGLVWGRVIVPELPWVWAMVAFCFLIYLAINLLFDRPVRTCATFVGERPLTSFGAGLLVLLLVGPVSLLLAVSVVGIAVIPFLLCAILAAGIVGKVAVARAVGMRIAAEDPDSRAHSVRSFVLGSVLIVLAYMIPVVGLVTWAIIGVLGLGAAALAFLSAYRRENPRPVAPPPALVPPVPPPPVPAPYMPPAATPAGGTPLAYEAAAQSETPLPPPGPAVVVGEAAASTLLLAMPRALFRDRLAAFVLDLILVTLTVAIIGGEPDDLLPPMLLVYHVGFWAWKQTTVGGIICQVRLVRTDGAPLGFADALVRGLGGIFSLAVFAIGVLWILRDPERQAWHDKIAGTYVVKVPRNWPI